jgi:hypothetical protein
LLTATLLQAQTNTGNISGVVTDLQGGVLPGATVTATHGDTGFMLVRVTDPGGRFFLPALVIGEWTVQVGLSGFTTQLRENIVIEVGREVSVNFTLSVGGLTEEVIVEARAPLLQATTAEISDVIENREVIQIPLNGRDFISLAQLSDGVMLPPHGTRGAELGQAGSLPNVGGQRAGHNIYLLDGVKITDELFNNLVIDPSVDSIQEFRIQKSMYPTEFGGKASALINVVTKSGSNVLRGSIFGFGRNDRFDSHNYFDDPNEPVPPLNQHQVGGSLGGPIFQNQTFFFLSYEGERVKRSLTEKFSVPGAAVRGGDFSGLKPICDPLTIDGPLGTCTPFVGNKIPTSRIDPIAAAFLQNVRAPNGVGESQNLTAVELQEKDVDQFSIRIDHRLSNSDLLFGRFSTFNAREVQPFGTDEHESNLIPGYGRSVETSTWNLGVSYTKLFGTSLLNELRFGWLRVDGGEVSLNRGVDFASQVGLTGVTRDPNHVGFPQIFTGGLYSTMGDADAFMFRRNEHFEIYDSFLINRRNHQIKFGGYFFHLRFRPAQPNDARGGFSYTGQFTGNALADFLLGYPTSARSGVGLGAEDGRTNWLHLFVQDDWRIRDNLTLNLGLRYEYNQHMRDTRNRLSSIDFSVPGGRFVIASDDAGNIDTSATALLPEIPIPWVTSTEAGWDRGLLRPSYLRLAPRIGFALALDDGRAVVRGGYGVFLNQWAYSVQTSFTRNLPFYFSKQVDVPIGLRVPTATTRNILGNQTTGSISASIMNHDYFVEYTQSWSGGLQYELFPSMMIEVSYLGSLTRGADNSTYHNVPEPGPGSIRLRRPIPELSTIRAIRFDGKSLYHALTLKAERRLSDAYSFNVSYTLSTSKDDASSPGATEAEANVPQNVRDIFDGEWAHSSFDHRHQFVASGTWELPTPGAPGSLINAVLGGWRLNPVVMLQSGAPFTINLGEDRANIGSGPAQRPNQLRDPNLPRSQRSTEQWFDTSAFVLPEAYTFGNAPRNSVLSPGYTSVDVAIAKVWRLQGAAELEFRWDIFNVFNHNNFDIPHRIFGSEDFGHVEIAFPAREMQFGVRLAF